MVGVLLPYVMSKTLTDADGIELESFYDAGWAQDRTDEMEIGRWSKYGNDRLYINSGIPKADKYSLYVDLETHEIVSDNEGKHSGGSVTINGDTATITIEESGDKEHEIVVSLSGDGFEADEDGDESEEIVTDGGEDKTSHIEDDEIEAAIESNDDTDHPDALTLAEVRDALAEIQASFEGFWAEHMDAIEDGHLEVVAETEHVVVFADHTGHGWNEELDALGLDRDRSSNDRTMRITLAETHHRAASRLCDRNWSTADPFVVAKPDGVRNGQLFVETVINSLLQRGLSPGQAWAYYGVEIRGNSRNSWAKRCGYSDHSAVSEAVRKAKKKLPKE